MIPLYIVAGPLGVGKTTAIRHVAAHSPSGIRTAVIVNDFGYAGFDEDRIRSADSPEPLDVFSIPGGCICCTAAVFIEAAIAKAAGLPRINRIIVEPSGMAQLGMFIKQVRRLEAHADITLAGTVVILNPGRWVQAAYEKVPFLREYADESDRIAGNREDSTPPDRMHAFLAWARNLQPPKRDVVATSYGRLPPEWFLDHVSRQPSANQTTHDHAMTFRAETFRCPIEGSRTLEALRRHFHEQNAELPERLKGIVSSPEGPVRVQWAQGELSEEPAGGNPTEPVLDVIGTDNALAKMRMVLGSCGWISTEPHIPKGVSHCE